MAATNKDTLAFLTEMKTEFNENSVCLVRKLKEKLALMV